MSGQQNETGNRKYLDQTTGNILYIFQYTDVKGSPFLNDDWMDAKVILNNGVTIFNLQMKFDVYNNKFLYSRNDTLFETGSNLKEIHLFQADDTTKDLIFRNGFTINGKITANIYLNVLAEGKISLLKNIKKEMEEYTEYGDATKYKRFIQLDQYFVSVNGQYKVVTLSKNNLQSILSDKWNVVSEYLSKKQFNGKDEKSWKSAVDYYNSL